MDSLEKVLSKDYVGDIETLWTLSFTFILLSIFKIERWLTSLWNAGSPNAMLESVQFPSSVGVYLLSPLLHSNGGHLATNLFLFVLFGAILEQRVDLRDYLTFVLGVGIVGNFVSPFLFQIFGVPVAFAIGMSGVTHALTVRETIYRVVVALTEEEHVIWSLVIFVIAAVVSLLSALAILTGGTQPGNSVVAHGTGLLLGSLFAFQEVNTIATIQGQIS